MNNDIKVRFKMYKKGCQWLTCILTLAGVTMFSVATGNADTMDQANDSNNIGVQKNINSSSVNLENAGSDSANYVSSAPTQTKAATVNNTSTALADSTDKASSPAVANDQNKSQDDFTQDNYVAMGDSITQGWDGQETVATPYPEKVSQILSFNSVNGSSYAIGGAHIDGNASSDFTQRVNDLITDPELNSYDIVSIDYGINDLNYGNNSLIDIQNAMIDGINKIISANGNIKIYGILPIASYKLGGQDNIGAGGFSENDLLNAEAEVYQSFRIPYLDWRSDPIVTNDNYKQMLGTDVRDYTHPTQSTYNIIAQRVADFFKNNLPSTLTEHKSTLVPSAKFTGLVHESSTDSWYYYNDTGSKVIGFELINSSGYTEFNAKNGSANFVSANMNGEMYFNTITGQGIKNQLININNGLYYFDNNGYAVSGLQTIDGNQYYFNNQTYQAATNTIITVNGKNLFFDNNGQHQSGGYYVKNGNAYYLDPNTGQNVKNKYLQTPVGWLMFGKDNNGAAVSGVYQWAGSYYYFDSKTHLKVTNSIEQASWGDWYGFGNDGRILTGVNKIGNTYYDFNAKTYTMIVNNYAKSQWGSWYLFGSDGKILTGVQRWAGSYYYFDPVTYLKRTNAYLKAQWGSWYLFGSDGRILTGVQKWAGTYYYFDSQTFLKVTNAYVRSQWGSWYLFANDGKIVSGWTDWMGSTYYFDQQTYLKFTGVHVINGQTYNFDKNGMLDKTSK